MFSKTKGKTVTVIYLNRQVPNRMESSSGEEVTSDTAAPENHCSAVFHKSCCFSGAQSPLPNNERSRKLLPWLCSPVHLLELHEGNSGDGESRRFHIITNRRANGYRTKGILREREPTFT